LESQKKRFISELMKNCLLKLTALCCLSIFASVAGAQSFFWVGFTDKKNSTYTLQNPSVYLSERSIQRRIRQGIPVDEADLPVNRQYTDSILKTGASLVHTSKWLNGITVQFTHDSLAQTIRKASFVKEVQLTRPASVNKSLFNKFEDSYLPAVIDTSFYGHSVYQVGQLNWHSLHQKDFKGKGIHIAVLDAGFYKVNILPAFNELRISGRIIGSRDFVKPTDDIYSGHTHGMMVLSTMAGYLPGEMIGTAPEASYWLLRSEDSGSEYLIEEDNWVAAAEFADSAGVDIINSSLGYSTFNQPAMNHTYKDMDGKTTRVARAANIAASRGILVFVSAGNEGNNSWKYIISPAAADSAIAVAAVDRYSLPAFFTSHGPASDGEVQPNLAALGLGAAVQNTDGKVGLANGTSFSCPILAGMAAWLWQAFPNLPASRIREALMLSAHLYHSPDSLLGFGIPDFLIAFNLLAGYPLFAGELTRNQWAVYPNPFTSQLNLRNPGNTKGSLHLEITGINGVMVFRKFYNSGGTVTLYQLTSVPPGIYLLKITTEKGTEVHKIIKRKG